MWFDIKIEEILLCYPKLEVQIILVVFYSLFWMITLPLLSNLFKTYIDKQSWKEQWITLSKINFKKALFIDYEKREDAYEMARMFLVVIIQHSLGGLLSSFSLLSDDVISKINLTRDVTNALACHGALSETGYELQEYLIRIHEHIFTKEGRKRSPMPLLILMSIHHFTGIFLIIPYNIKFRDSGVYHEIIFLLQFAAGITLIFQNYGYIINVEEKGGLKRMRIVSFIVFLTVFWSRIARFGYLAYRFITLSINQESFIFNTIMILSVFSLSTINLIFFIDSCKRLMKFLFADPNSIKIVDVDDEDEDKENLKTK